MSERPENHIVYRFTIERWIRNNYQQNWNYVILDDFAGHQTYKPVSTDFIDRSDPKKKMHKTFRGKVPHIPDHVKKEAEERFRKWQDDQKRDGTKSEGLIKFGELLGEEYKLPKRTKMPKVWYHCTSLSRARKIAREGFDLNQPRNEGSLRRYGDAIWFANPPHAEYNAYSLSVISTGAIAIELDSSFNILDLRSEKKMLETTRRLLEFPEIRTNARKQYANVSDERFETMVKSGYIYFDEDLWPEAIMKLGYDGILLIKDDPGFYVGLWLGIFNVEKLNQLPMKVLAKKGIEERRPQDDDYIAYTYGTNYVKRKPGQ